MRVALLVLMPLILASSWFYLGYAFGKQKAKREAEAGESREPAEPPVCGCGHNLAMHDLKAGRCLALGMRGSQPLRADWQGFGGREPCGCQQYIGPDHPSMYLPFMGGSQ